MDLIIGGGKYGEKAFEALQTDNTPVVVLDTNPACALRTHWHLPFITMDDLAESGLPPEGGGFIRGGIAEAADVIARCRPERVFPTVPVHVSAGILSECAGFEPVPAGADEIAAHIPERFIVGRRGADIYCSQNPDQLCRPDCPEPPVCPVTGERRDLPLWSMLGNYLSGPVPDNAVPGGADTHWTVSAGGGTGTVIIQSRQCGPGLGYILASDLFSAIDRVREEQRVWIATACKCHGVVTALGKNEI